MANVKLTWNDNADNEDATTGYRIYRNTGTVTAAAGVWADEAVPTGANVDDTATAISPEMSREVADTESYIDTNVPTGTWTYRVSAWNSAGETFCVSPDVKVVTVS